MTGLISHVVDNTILTPMLSFPVARLSSSLILATTSRLFVLVVPPRLTCITTQLSGGRFNLQLIVAKVRDSDVQNVTMLIEANR